MAEDDDDEAFGDFSFAPFQSNSLFNAPNSSAAAAEEDEDDEWGDFVQPPSQSKPAETAANGDHRSANSVPPATWMMPRGALPLSLFGDVEEEEAVAGDLVVAGDLNQQKSNGIARGVGSGLVGNGIHVSNQKSFSIADLYDDYLQIKHESHAGSELGGKDDSVNNGVYSSANQNGAESAAPELKNVNLSNALVVSDYKNQHTIKSGNEEFGFKSYMSDPSKEEDLFGGRKGDFDRFSSSLSPSPENVLMLSFGLDTNGEKKQVDGSNNAIDGGGGGDDDDDEEWDFKDARTEFQAQDVNSNVGLVVQKVSESSPYSSGNGIGLIKPIDLFGTSNGSIDFFASSTKPVDLFANSSSIPITSQSMDLIGIPNLATLNSLTSDEHSIIEQNNVRGQLGYATDVGIDELDEDFGDFSAASARTGIETKEVFTNNVLSPNKGAIQTPDAKIQEKDTNLNHNKRAIPLSIFGDEEPERGSTSDVQDFFVHQSIPAKRSDHIASSVNSINDMISDLYSQADQTSSTNTEHNLTESHLNPSSAVSSSVLVDGGGGGNDDDDDDSSWDFKDASEMRFDSSANSINDMISNLYSQAEQTSVNTEHNLTESQLNPSSVVSSFNLVSGGGGGGDDDDSSWDFKDASEMRFDSEASLTSTVDPYRSKLSKLKLDNYLDFYSKLKEELCFVVKHHIDRLKNAQGDADLSAEGARAASFDSEFKLFCNEPEHMNFLNEEGDLQDHHKRDSHIHEFTQILLEPQFQRLESEFHLSHKLLIVERDPGSSMELIRHTHTMLKILNVGTMDEQKLYVSLWSEMMSVCAQELRHGALIWNDAVVKRVQSQFLSEPQGREFILALGEIYRVVVVIGASATLFKPWILSSAGDLPSLNNLIEECHALWSTSGLEEALSSVLTPTTFEDSSLFKSIKHILGLDVLKLENYVFAEKEARCRLSLLTAGVVPDLKIVMWGNEQCFVTLANLWANLIGFEPPKLPQLNLG